MADHSPETRPVGAPETGVERFPRDDQCLWHTRRERTFLSVPIIQCFIPIVIENRGLFKKKKENVSKRILFDVLLYRKFAVISKSIILCERNFPLFFLNTSANKLSNSVHKTHLQTFSSCRDLEVFVC